MILGMGNEIYHGSTDKMPEYFEKIDHPIPTFHNPAEHVLSLVNQDFIGDPEKAKKVAIEFASKWEENKE